MKRGRIAPPCCVSRWSDRTEREDKAQLVGNIKQCYTVFLMDQMQRKIAEYMKISAHSGIEKGNPVKLTRTRGCGMVEDCTLS
jgi:hypothetical protein